MERQEVLCERASLRGQGLLLGLWTPFRQDAWLLDRLLSPLHSLMENGEPQPVFQGTKNFRGTCMQEGCPPFPHPTKGKTTESGRIKRKRSSQGSGRLTASSCHQASARGMSFGARHLGPFPTQAAGLQPDPSHPLAQHITFEGESMTTS